jgi:hypothetical protein
MTAVGDPYEYVGAVHVHTVHSDGAATPEEIARIAARSGLDFVIATDHNVRAPGIEGWYEKVLLLLGEEVNDPQRHPECNHLLIFGADHSLAPYAADAQGLIDAARRAGGFAFLAHPFEHAQAFTGESDINWQDWDVHGFTGIELWNTMSEVKSRLRNLSQAILMAYFPGLGLRGPPRETLERWDQLLTAGQQVAIIGGPDAHGTVYRKGIIEREVLPYEWLFRAVRLHVLCDGPFQGNLEQDAAQVYRAMRGGRAFVAYDRIGDATGFRFLARTGGAEFGMGEQLASAAGVALEVNSPKRARLRIVHEGRVVAEGYGKRLRCTASACGAYRAEAHRRHGAQRSAWVFTNPIYLMPGHGQSQASPIPSPSVSA